MATTRKQPKYGFRKLKTLSSDEIARLLPGGCLDNGSHRLTDVDDDGRTLRRPVPEGVCLMEAVAYVTGEPHSDAPKCADPTLTAIGIDFNDSHTTDDYERNKLIAAIPALVGSKTGSRRVRFKRAKRFAQLVLARYIDAKSDEVIDSSEERLVDALTAVSNLRSLAEVVKARELLAYLEGDEYHKVYLVVSRLAKAWDSAKGLSQRSLDRIIVENTWSDMFKDGDSQAELLTSVGYTRA